MRHILSALTLLLLPLAALADQTVEFTVSAGKHDRANEPVVIPLELPFAVSSANQVEVTDSKGRRIGEAELSPPGLARQGGKPSAGKHRLDLCFVLPSLKAGESATLKAVIGDSARATFSGFVWMMHPQEKWMELKLRTRPILRLVAPTLDESSKEARDRTFKPFHHVYDPKGERIVTNGAGGRFPHHRGLFYGFAKTGYVGQVVDTWHCPPPGKKNEAHQAYRDTKAMAVGTVRGSQQVEIDWNGVGKKTFAKELRELSVWNVPGGTLIDFASLLTPTDGPVKLDGDPQHAGFHFRAANEVNDKTAKQTIYIRPDGTDKPGATRNWDGKKNTSHVNLPWLAMSFVLGGQRYTCAYLDRPDNPKEARFSERDYGRFGSYFVTTVTKEKPLLVRYRVWLQEGQMTPEQVKAKSVQFVEPVEVRLK